MNSLRNFSADKKKKEKKKKRGVLFCSPVPKPRDPVWSIPEPAAFAASPRWAMSDERWSSATLWACHRVASSAWQVSHPKISFLTLYLMGSSKKCIWGILENTAGYRLCGKGQTWCWSHGLSARAWKKCDICINSRALPGGFLVPLCRIPRSRCGLQMRSRRFVVPGLLFLGGACCGAVCWPLHTRCHLPLPREGDLELPVSTSVTGGFLKSSN